MPRCRLPQLPASRPARSAEDVHQTQRRRTHAIRRNGHARAAAIRRPRVQEAGSTEHRTDRYFVPSQESLELWLRSGGRYPPRVVRDRIVRRDQQLGCQQSARRGRHDAWQDVEHDDVISNVVLGLVRTRVPIRIEDRPRLMAATTSVPTTAPMTRPATRVTAIGESEPQKWRRPSPRWRRTRCLRLLRPDRPGRRRAVQLAAGRNRTGAGETEQDKPAGEPDGSPPTQGRGRAGGRGSGASARSSMSPALPTIDWPRGSSTSLHEHPP